MENGMVLLHTKLPVVQIKQVFGCIAGTMYHIILTTSRGPRLLQQYSSEL